MPRDRVESLAEQTFLDPINPQSAWSEALLDLFVNRVLVDSDYCQRLKRHYRLFKAVVNDPTHPGQRRLRRPGAEQARRPAPPGRPRRERKQRR